MNYPLRTEDVSTPVGTARVTLGPAGGRGLVVLGHGAGGGIEARDLVAVTAALTDAGWTVARVEQPYRVSGRRAPDRAPNLDAAWTAVLGALRAQAGPAAGAVPLVLGGRSSGARVACRTAAVTGAAAVVCLAFPLQPPGRTAGGERRPSRADELTLAVDSCPVLVVQGERDPFGRPAEFPAGPTVRAVEGDHSLRRTAPVAAAVVTWLDAQRLA